MKTLNNSRRGERAFDLGIYLISGMIALICLYPLYLVLINSFSDPFAVARGEVYLVPQGFSFDAYIEAFKNGDIMRGYANSLFYLVFGVTLNMVLTIPAAYALSKQNMKGRNVIMMMIVFTMYFSGGLIPHYLMVRDLGLINTRAVVILEGAVVTTNLIIARTFFSSSVPKELEEAAEIDGCSGIQVFFKIVLPLSKAMLGVILLYYAVGRWNNYTSSLYYQPRAEELHSLQMVIKKMVLQMQAAANAESEMAEYYANLFNQIKYSVIVIASLPLLVLYPFLQKYFEKGVMIGSVKG
ncbi:MAG: carbohydrate ABC transporter permease [Oscillospiraceae bacterium]|nr:carbohydrate ABC transporter permease [Oscillospiraceae bacterium]